MNVYPSQVLWVKNLALHPLPSQLYYIIIIIIIIIITKLLSNFHADIYSPIVLPVSFNRRGVKSAAYCNIIPVFIRNLKYLSTREIWCLVCSQDRMWLYSCVVETHILPLYAIASL